MEAKKSNKIRDIARLQQILKKWKKLTITDASKTNNSNNNNNNKGIKLLKKTLSFSDNNHIPKGYLAVCVGKELKRFVIPTEYLSHQAFRVLLREAEEEFGFEQEGVLKIPCDVAVFERILEFVQKKKRFVDRNDCIFVHELMFINYSEVNVVSELL